MDAEITIMLGFAGFVLAVLILVGATEIKVSISLLISLAFGILIAVLCITENTMLVALLIIILTIVAITLSVWYKFRK